MSQHAFQDYAALKSAMADWLMRQDLEDRIPQFIRLAEAQLDQVLRVKEMVVRDTFEAKSRYLALPEGWRKLRNVQRVSDGTPLGFMTLDEIDRYMSGIVTNRILPDPQGPTYYSLLGDEMELAPAPSQSNPAELELTYYMAVPRLSQDSDSSWLLEKYPDAYLYGALIHSAPFLKDDERVAMWQGLYQQAVTLANESDANARYSGAPMNRRIGF